jgi:ABC-2 type transport system permease protein
MVFSSVFLLFGRDAWQVTNMLQEPVYLLSGFYFPVRNFGLVLAVAASILPLTLGLDAMRQLIFASGPTLGFVSVPIEIAVLAALCLGFMGGSKFWLDHVEKLAVQEGTLTDRRK